MLHPTVFNTSQICYQLGVRHAVLSPGSRNAPLLLSFSRHDGIEKVIVPDERAAGFIALGIAQKTQSPVILSCTSGTALLNYAPAIAEAYYREIPLVVLSADRPPELIDQRDGQTIRQFEVLKNHVKKSVQLPVVRKENDARSYQQKLIDSVLLADQLPRGPIHVNVPFEEPFYPEENQGDLIFKEVAIDLNANEEPVDQEIELPENKKVLILVGQADHNEELSQIIETLSQKTPIIRSPLNNLQYGISHVDGFIKDQLSLKPDILITTGLSVLSKNLKQFLRNHTPDVHYHFDAAGVEVDTYDSSPKIIRQSIVHFLKSLNKKRLNQEYLSIWKHFEMRTHEAITLHLQHAKFSETTALYHVFNSFPLNITLHLSNSMPVRFADLFGVSNEVKTYSNRGTSGIDGCTSTALGTALVSSNLNVLVTGDLAFLYDRNAFFHHLPTSNLRVVVINNQGGGIFRLIKGPSSQPELEDYFETRHDRTAEYICAENGLAYLTAANHNELKKQWDALLTPSNKGKVLEIFTDPRTNETEYKKLRNYIDEQIRN